MTQDDLLYRFRLRTFAMAAELGNVRAACRAMGIHPSTYYRWKHQLDRYGPEICGSTWNATCATTTPNAPTPVAGPRAGLQRRSSGRPNCGRRSADASPQLGDRTF
jgi:transposase-like protein